MTDVDCELLTELGGGMEAVVDVVDDTIGTAGHDGQRCTRFPVLSSVLTVAGLVLVLCMFSAGVRLGENTRQVVFVKLHEDTHADAREDKQEDEQENKAEDKQENIEEGKEEDKEEN